MANVLGDLLAEDDADILSFLPAPDDPRSVAVEGPGTLEIMREASEMPSLAKYAAMIVRGASSKMMRRCQQYTLSFHVADESMRRPAMDAADGLRAESLSDGQTAVLENAAPTLRALFDARALVKSSGDWPQSFTKQAAL